MTTTRTYDIDAIVAAVRTVGDGIAAALPGVPRPVGRAAMFAAFASVDDPAAARLRALLAAIHPEVAWADEDELDTAAQRDAAGGGTSGPRWVCDAVDGAVQALAGIPAWATTLALVDGGRTELAVVYAPEYDELYHAVAGCGAWLNGVPIAPTGTSALGEAIVAHTHVPFQAGHPEDIARTAASLGAVLPRAFAVRNLGPTALQIAWVGAGKLDAFWEFGTDLHNWLAGALIAAEAGAMVTGPRGEPFGPRVAGLCVATPGVHRELAGVLAGVE
ncbi:inositol monophosphatase family protein [Yinghuangia seranimata]|uniref:inositol monophosphatase family protein n=1 Tax=Yinghuangia seranimata TaxID=408067 RepID=UPI00248B4F8D|nr:inositol monophosphatase family protein [Yinghuangia seranimata]MDI2132932.1 inositol monophosphatase family protein [Yinghuangia seranimata]